MKVNKATICDGIPAVAWKMLLTNVEVTEILTKLFNIIRSKREFPKEWKTALIQPICTGNGIRKQPGNYKGISLLPVLGKYTFRNTADLPRDVGLSFFCRYTGYVPFTCPKSCNGIVIMTCWYLGRITSCSRSSRELNSRESTNGVSRVICTESSCSEGTLGRI
jgi:hypothetical protein